jgi:hypothetical protein
LKQTQQNMFGSYIPMAELLRLLVSQCHNLTCIICKSLKHTKLSFFIFPQYVILPFWAISTTVLTPQ